MVIRQVVWRITRALLVLFLLGFCFDIMDEQEAEVNFDEHLRHQIHIYEYDLV